MWGYSPCWPVQRCHQEIDLTLLSLVNGMKQKQNAGLDFVMPVIDSSEQKQELNLKLIYSQSQQSDKQIIH